jgi:hypothetical protein
MDYIDGALDARDVMDALKVKKPFIENMTLVGWRQGVRWWALTLQNEEYSLTLRGLNKKMRRLLNGEQPKAPDVSRVGGDPTPEGSGGGDTTRARRVRKGSGDDA